MTVNSVTFLVFYTISCYAAHRNEVFPQLDFEEEQNVDNYTKKKRERNRRRRRDRKRPVGLQMNTASYVLAANLGPIM